MIRLPYYQREYERVRRFCSDERIEELVDKFIANFSRITRLMFETIKGIIGDIAAGAIKDQRILLSQEQLTALDLKLCEALSENERLSQRVKELERLVAERQQQIASHHRESFSLLRASSSARRKPRPPRFDHSSQQSLFQALDFDIRRLQP